MATVDERFAANIAANNGYYNGDSDNTMGDNPRCIKIVKYDNSFGGVSYGAIFEGERNPNKYAPSRYVRNPRTYWEYQK